VAAAGCKLSVLLSGAVGVAGGKLPVLPSWDASSSSVVAL
jgi:hypothetical protein